MGHYGGCGVMGAAMARRVVLTTYQHKCVVFCARCT